MKLSLILNIFLLLTSINILSSTEDFYEKYNQPKDAQGSQTDFLKFLESGDCKSCDLRGFDLRDAIKKLNNENKKINLFNSDCSYADMSDANLCGADLNFVKCEYANLQNSNLDSVEARNSSFRFANMQKTNVHNANFLDSNLTGSNFEGSNFDSKKSDFEKAKFAVGLINHKEDSSTIWYRICASFNFSKK